MPMLLVGGAALSTVALATHDSSPPVAAAPPKPNAPTSYNDNSAPVINARSTAGATNDTTPGLNIGTGLTNPKLYVNGKEVAATYDATTGTLTPNAPLPEGSYKLTYTYANSDGVYSEQSAPLAVVVDTTPPAKPATATGYNDNVGAVQNANSTAATTDDSTPGLNVGKGLTGAKLYVDGVQVPAAYDAETGTLTPSTPLADGAHKITYTVSDEAGNESVQSDPISVAVNTVNVVKPPAPTGYDDNSAPIVNAQSTAPTTNDTTPGLKVGSGLANPKLYVDGTEVSATYDSATGTLTPTAPLSEGRHSLTYANTNASGVVSEQSDPLVLTVDTTPPATPTTAPVGYKDDVGSVQSASSTAAATDDPKPGILVGQNLTDTPKLYVDGVLVVAAYDPATGTLTPSTALAEGAHTFSYTLTDAAGNESGKSPALSITVDTTAPKAGSEGALTLMDDVGAVKGEIARGGMTDDARPTFKGTGAGADVAKVNVYDGNTLVGSATGNSNGNWSFEPTTPMSAGDHNLTARAVDAAGNEGPASSGWNFKVQGDTPAQPTITGVSDNAGSVTGTISKGATTDDTSPTVTGTGTAGNTVELYANGQKVGTTTVAQDGTWTVTSDTLTGDGTKLLTAKTIDGAGQSSAETSASTIVLDTTAPTRPGVVSATDDQGSVQGPVANGGTTDDTTPTLSGAGTPGDTIKVYDNGTLLGSVPVQSNGSWSFTPAAPLGSGTHAITTTATDAAGNMSAASDPLSITVDTSGPVSGSEGTLTLLDDVGSVKGEIARGSMTDDARPTFKGMGAGADVAKVNVYDGATLLGSASVTNGSWIFEPATPLASGDHNLTARPVDAAGNEGPASTGWNFKLLGDAPAQPAITGVSDNAGSVTGNIAKGATTDDTTPTVSGTGTAGTTVKLYADGVEVGSTTVAADGTWRVSSSTLTGDGTKLLTAKAIDGAGQSSSETGAYAVVLDTTAPAKPGLASATDDQGAVQGSVANGGTTDDATPTLSGSGTPGDTVKVYDNGTLLGSAAVQTNGSWSFTPTTPLTSGAHAITTTATDAAGNTSAGSDPLNFTVDTSNVTVSVGKATDNAGSKQGDLANGASTDDTTPTLVGTAAANATVTVKEGATTLGTATADASGAWSFTLPAQAQGVHSYTVEARNAAGTTGSTSFGLTIDTTAPGVPAIGGVTDDVGTVQGPVANNASTDDTTPTLSGTGGTAGDTIKVYDNGSLLGSTQVQANGSWSFTPQTPLTDGSHPLTVTATDPQGNESTPSAAYTVKVDTAAPTTPTAAPAGYKDDVGAVQSASSTAATTDDTRPGILVGQNLTDTPKLYVDGGQVAVAATYDPVTGTLTPTAALPDGAHTFSYTLTDAAGNESGKSPALSITVDTSAPAVGSEGTLTLLDDVGSVKGEITRGSVTDDARPTFKGMGAGADVAKVNVYDGATLLGSAPVSNGSWSFEPATPLASGDHNLTARAVDAAGNEGPVSAGWNFKLLGDAPAAPAITGVNDDAGSVMGSIAKGAATDDTTPTVSGTGTAGTTVKLYADGVEVGSTTVAQDGTWRVTSSALVGDGTKQLTAMAIDGAGQSSPQTGAYAIVLDTTAPAKPGTATATDDQGSVQGPVANGGTTDDAYPTLSGSGTPGDAVKVYDNGTTLLGTAQVQANGSWSFTPTTPLGSGAHAITSTATDAAGNTSAASDPLNFTVDTSNVTVSVGKATDNAGSKQGDLANGASTDDTTPTLVGTAAAGATVTVKEGAISLGTATADANGAWTFTLPAQAQGVHNYTVEARNAAGTTGSTSFALTVDTTAPAVPAIGDIADDVGTVQGSVANGASTDDTTPTLSGTGGTPGDTIKVYDNGVLLGSTQIKQSGGWSFTPLTPLTDGSHPLTVTATDPQGNESTPSAAYTVKVDTAAPTTPTAAPAGYKDDVGAVQSANSTAPTTDDTKPGIQVGANLIDTPKLYVDGVQVSAAYDPVAGTLTPTSPLADGAHAISYTLTDAAGNESGKSPSLSLTVDTSAPAAGGEGTLTLLDDVGAVKGEIAPGSMTDDAKPTFKGMNAGADVAKVNVYDGATLLGSATVTNRSWTFEPSTPLASGDHTLTARPVDAAGNEGPAGAGWNFKLLGDAPKEPAITGVTDNAGSVTGSIAKGATTDDTTPTVSGTGTAGTTVKLYADGVEVGSTTVAADGTWRVTSSNLTGDGTKLLTAKAIDGAGQSSAETGAYSIVLDTTAPVKPGVAAATDDQGAVQGPVANNGTTDDSTPTLSGSGTPGDTVKVYDNGTLLGSAAVQANGSWSFTPTTQLVTGAHAITTTATDAAGNTSAASDPLNFTVDTSNVNVSVSKATDNAGSKQGDLANGASTDDTTPTLVGTAAAGATITVKEGATTLGTATADGNGAWTFALPQQAQGLHNYTVEARNAAGTTGSTSFGLTIDTTPPSVPAISGVTDDVGTVQGPVASGGSTDDTTPTLTGMAATAGDVIKVYGNGSLLGSTTVQSNGTWSFTPTAPLIEGSHPLTVTATDPQGNESTPSAAYTVKVDTTSPTTPAVPVGYKDDVGAVQSATSTAPTTDDTRPGILVGQNLSETPKLYVDGVQVAAAYDPATGTLTPSTALSEGAHNFSYTLTDAAGNESGKSPALSITVDSSGPAAGSEGTLTLLDDVGSVKGEITRGSVTDDARPTFKGMGAGADVAKVNVYDGATLLGSASVTNGSWIFEPATPLASGDHNLTARPVDAAGNEGPASTGWNFKLLGDAPAQPAITSVNDNAGSVTGNLGKGDTTDDTTPTVSGTGTAGTTVKLYADSVEVGSTTVAADGTWRVSSNTLTGDGTKVLTAKAFDGAGQSSTETGGYAIVLDTTAPAKPGVAAATDDQGAVKGPVANGGTTDDSQPAFSGSGTPGDTVKVYDTSGGTTTLLGSALVQGNGSWSYTPTAQLGNGVHAITTTATDAAGNTSTASDPLNFTVDTSNVSVSVSRAVDDAGSKKGDVGENGFTDDTTPTLVGTAAAGATITVKEGATTLGTATADANGAWSFTPATAQAQGLHTYTVEARNAAGTTGSTDFRLTIDTTPPAVPSISGVSDDVGTVQGPVANGASTDDTTPTLTGIGGTPGDTIKIYDNGNLLGSVTVQPNGSWSYTSTPLNEGSHPLTVTATDPQGNESLPSGAYTVNVDTTRPGTPAAPVGYKDDVGAVQSASSTAATTDDTRPGILVGQNLTDMPKLYVDGGQVAVAAAYDPVTGTLTPTAALPDGAHTFSYTLTDAAGNESGKSPALSITVDTSAPAVGSEGTLTLLDDVGSVKGEITRGSMTDDSRPTFKGVGAGADVAKVNVYDGATLLGSAPVSNGSWSFEPATPLASGDHNLTARPVDAAGNEGTGSTGWNFKLLGDAPVQPAITNVHDNAGNVTGSIAKGAATDDTTPTVSGTGTAGTTIKLYANGTEVGSTTVLQDGTWSVTSTALTGDGTKLLTAKAIDGAGQSSSETGAYQIVLDTTPPAKPGAATATDDQGAVQGSIANGGTTDDSAPAFSGSGTPGDTVKVYDNGTLLGSALVQSNGSWSFTPTTQLTSGAHAITTTATDAAGNTSAASDPLNFTVDTSNVTVSVSKAVDNAGSKQGDLANGGSTDDTTPTLVGTAAAGATITIKEGATTLGTATADASGAWSFTLPTQPDALHNYTVEARNAAGTTGSTNFALTIDTTAPAVPAISGVSDDVGPVQGPVANNASTDDTTPTLTGTGGTPGDTIKVYDNGSLLGSATVGANGSWSFTASPLNEGSHPLTVTATDPQGNESGPSGPYTINVDTTRPTTPAAPVGYKDDQGSVQNANSTAPTTDDSKPGILVGQNLTDTPKLYVDGSSTAVAATYDPATGTLTPTTALADGAHTFSYTLTDAAGNESFKSPALSITVDTGTPAAGARPTSYDDNSSPIVDANSTAPATNDSTPGVKIGTGLINPKLYVNGTAVNATYNTSTGTLTPDVALADGDYNLTYTSANSAGTQSAQSLPLALKIDHAAPAAPTVTLDQDTAGTQTGTANDAYTSNGSYTVAANSVEQGAVVQYSVDGGANWSTTKPNAVEGANTISVRQIDVAGNVGASNSLSFTLDTSTPAPSQTTAQNVFVGNTPSFVLTGQQVNTTTAGDQSGPVTVATSNGGYFTAWYDNALNDPAGAVHGQYYAADGTKIGNELTFGGGNWQVNGNGYADMPMLNAVALDNGKVVLSWQTEDSNGGVGGGGSNGTTEVAYATATLNGTTATAGAPTLANTTLGGNQSGPAMVATKDGGFFMAWYNADDTDPQGVVRGQFFDANGNKSGGELQLGSWHVNGDSWSVGQPPLSAVTLGNGSIAVAWTAENGPSGPNTGSSEVAQVVVSSTGVVGPQSLANTTTAGNQGAPVMVATSDGGYFIAWFNDDSSTKGGQGQISGQYFNASGSKVGGEVALGSWVVNENTQVDMPFLTATALKGGKVAVGWQTEDSTNNTGPTDTNEAAMVVVSNNAGTVTVGTQAVINTTTAGNQSPPTMVGLDTGGFFAAWYDDSWSDPGNSVIRGQYFNAQGQKVGSEILVSNYRAELSDAGEQPPLHVTALVGGKVVVSWNTEADDARDGSGAAVYQAVINMPAATVVDGTAEINSTVTLKNGAGTVLGTTVTDAQGHWQITTSDVQDSSKPLYATVVDKAGNSVTKPLNFTPPVVLDLNHDGRIDYGHVVMDVTGDGVAERTTWTGANDGVLVWDKHGDGVVHDSSQYAFTQYGGSTDLQGLAARFDTNHDGVFDAHDKEFSQFAVWRDANQNGVSDAGEVRSLADWGITSIHLTSDGQVRHSDGVVEFGRSTATMADGSTMLVADAMFAHESLDALVQNATVAPPHGNPSMDDASPVTVDMKPLEVHAFATKPLLLTADANDMVPVEHATLKHAGEAPAVDNHAYAVWNSEVAHLLVDQNATLHPVL